MTERRTFDSFEQRVAAEFERYVEPADDPRPVSEIADTAMRPRRPGVRARNVARPRRILLIGLAAAFLVPAAYLGAMSLRAPAPDLNNQVQPPPSEDPRPTPLPSASSTRHYVSIFVRRDEAPTPGLSIFAVRPDGSEALVRHVPDSVVPGGGTLWEWGTVSESGWLAIGSEKDPWPMVVIDLRRQDSTPWVVNESNTGGIGPRWGPTGLVAADAGGNGDRVVIADPETHSTRIISMGSGLVGGGPSIVWAADGSGIVGSTGGGTYHVVPVDGGSARPGVGDVFDPRGGYGPGLAGFRVCTPDQTCAAPSDGRVERVEVDGSTRTIWQQTGVDQALAAHFGRHADEYWLAVDHDQGRQVVLVHVQDGQEQAVATVDRAADWQYVDAPIVAPDDSAAVLFIDIGAKPAGAVVPFGGTAPTFHPGHFAGFVDGAASAVFSTGPFETPTAPAPTPDVAQIYPLPPLDQLIAAELASNPGRTVLGQASRDAVIGQTDARTFEVNRDKPGAGAANLDCFGPSSVTVTSGLNTTTSPCRRFGSYGLPIDARGPIIVTASGDTSWRVVVYSP